MSLIDDFNQHYASAIIIKDFSLRQISGEYAWTRDGVAIHIKYDEESASLIGTISVMGDTRYALRPIEIEDERSLLPEYLTAVREIIEKIEENHFEYERLSALLKNKYDQLSREYPNHCRDCHGRGGADFNPRHPWDDPEVVWIDCESCLHVDKHPLDTERVISEDEGIEWATCRSAVAPSILDEIDRVWVLLDDEYKRRARMTECG